MWWRAAPARERFKAGQPVFIAGYDIGNRGGLYAEYVAVPEDGALGRCPTASISTGR